MKKRILVGAVVLAAVVVAAVFSVGAASRAERAAQSTGFSIGLVELPRPAQAEYDELMDPEFGCGDSGYHEYVDPG